MQKANSIDEIYNAVSTLPLEINELDKFYRDTNDVRSNLSARFQLKTKIRQNAGKTLKAHYLFVGYRGCGKSTELNYLQKELQEDPQNKYAVLNYSVMKELDPQSIEYIELFIVIMHRLFTMATEMSLDIDKNFIKKIENWTHTTEIEAIKNRHFSAEAEAGSETKVGIPYLQKFFFKMNGAAKISKSFKETIKHTLEPRLADLINLCNELISAIRIELVGHDYRDLVIFIEDLDKIPLIQAEKLFFNYANQLTQLRATVVYTFPISLFHNTSFGGIRGYFTEVIELPMIKLAEKNGLPYPAGIAVMEDIVDARINKALFASPEILPLFISKTGGIIRDLFTMLNGAATFALSRESATISEEHFIYAYNNLKREYRNSIADFVDKKGVNHTAAEIYSTMADLATSADKMPDNSDVLMLLRQNLCVLSYNGEGWCDVHPVMKDVLRERHQLN